MTSVTGPARTLLSAMALAALLPAEPGHAQSLGKLEVSRGRPSRGRGARMGALVGFAIGAIAVLATPCDADCMDMRGPGVAVLGAAGAGLGASIGLAIPPGEKWESVPIASLGVVPGRHGHVRVSVSLAF